MNFILKKRWGKIYYSLAAFLIVFSTILVVFEIKINGIKMVKNLAEDSIAASNLACLIVDLEEFGATHNIQIKDVNKAYNIYCNSLKGNMNLNNDFIPASEEVIKGKITIHQFILFNVSGDQITKTEILNGKFWSEEVINGQVGIMTTPDGTLVSNTTVYSKIGFAVRGFMNYQHYVYKENSVDIIYQ